LRIILTYFQNVWQIGYIMQSILMGITSHRYDIDWNGYDHDYIPEYRPLLKRTKAREAEHRLRRNYSPQLLNILTAMVQFRVEQRPTPEEVLDVIKENMPQFTEGMERWGTNEWFEALNNGDIDVSAFDASVDGSMISMISEGAPLRGGPPNRSVVESLTDKFKNLVCFPASRRRRRRKTTIVWDLSPYSTIQAKNAQRKRRQDMVERQIREGLRPKLQRYVSPDAADDIFDLKDDLKIIHPQRESTLTDYFSAPDPVPTTYREDIDDVETYLQAKTTYERLHPVGFPRVGVDEYNFRMDGTAAGEVVHPPKPPPHGAVA
jgi:hypothetical protein